MKIRLICNVKEIHRYSRYMEAFVYELGTMFLHTILWWCQIIHYERGEGKFAEVYIIDLWNEKAPKEEFPRYELKNHNRIGVAGLYSMDENSKNGLWIGWFAILKEYRNKGWGTKTLKELEKQAKKEGARYLNVYVESKSRAEKFYTKNGYKFAGRVDDLVQAYPHKYRYGDEFDDPKDSILQKKLK
jgi:GNAT superfamily N-acetyltransferase